MKALHFFLLFSLVSLAFAEQVMKLPVEDKAVHDFAGILSSQEVVSLESKLRAYHTQSGNALILVTVKNMDGDSIEHYANFLAETWGVGDKQKDNGMVILAVLEERKLRIEVGYGLEEYVTDAQSRHIIEEFLTPAFKTGKYYDGFDKSVDAIKALTASNVTAVVPTALPSATPLLEISPILSILSFIPILLISCVAIAMIKIVGVGDYTKTDYQPVSKRRKSKTRVKKRKGSGF